ncbi:YaiI/YqxD family protein [Clostridium sp.]|uniref:YaiI/YqxD family protein n=1 Tax=Clostridium sp. TaxID=1506 RepID=UPI001DC55D06|nr:YaiI/YqxD family protein [Clostridium sp.]MBS5939708.1 YaiI/YqxD family protein [Clostridium sp.]
MRIIVDGDACPGISIIEKIAKSYKLDLIVYCDINHYIALDYGEVKIVDSGFQSVDMYVVNTCIKNDIIISQDYGVAAICLGKGAFVINPKGYNYTNKNIDRLLEERHISQKIRKAGGRTNNPRKRTKEDDIRLKTTLEKIIECNLRE